MMFRMPWTREIQSTVDYVNRIREDIRDSLRESKVSHTVAHERRDAAIAAEITKVTDKATSKMVIMRFEPLETKGRQLSEGLSKVTETVDKIADGIKPCAKCGHLIFAGKKTKMVTIVDRNAREENRERQVLYAEGCAPAWDMHDILLDGSSKYWIRRSNMRAGHEWAEWHPPSDEDGD